jgi:hypothetical protein
MVFLGPSTKMLVYYLSYPMTTPKFSLIYHPPNHLMLCKAKAVPVTGHEGPYGCETLRLPHFLDSRLTDGGEVFSLTRRPPFTSQEDSWYSFLLEAESTPGPKCGYKD